MICHIFQNHQHLSDHLYRIRRLHPLSINRMQCTYVMQDQKEHLCLVVSRDTDADRMLGYNFEQVFIYRYGNHNWLQVEVWDTVIDGFSRLQRLCTERTRPYPTPANIIDDY